MFSFSYNLILGGLYFGNKHNLYEKQPVEFVRVFMDKIFGEFSFGEKSSKDQF